MKIEKNDNLISSISSTALIDALSVGFKDEFERLEKLLVIEENGERVVYKEMINDNYRSIVQYVSTTPNGCTTLDILERYDDKQNAYNQLVCGEYYGDLKNDNGLWKYHDAFHERRTQIGKLLAENEEERASISSHLQTFLNQKEEAKNSILCESFDEKPYIEKYQSIKDEISEKQRYHASLGIFKGKEKKRVEQEITELQRALSDEENRKRKDENQFKADKDNRLVSLDNEERQLREKLADLDGRKTSLGKELLSLTDNTAGENCTEDISLEQRIVFALDKLGKPALKEELQQEALSDCSNKTFIAALQTLKDRRIIEAFISDDKMQFRLSNDFIEKGVGSFKELSLEELILRALSKEGRSSISDLFASDKDLGNYSHQQVSATLRRLCDEGKVKKIVEDKKAFFQVITELQDRNAEEAPLDELVFESLSQRGKSTVTELITSSIALYGYTNQQVSAQLRRLCEQGKVKKTIEGKNAYFYVV